MNSSGNPSIKIRRAKDRFHSDLGWLDSYHTFSFGEHYDPELVGFETLRVINDDTVAPKRGFGEHGHAGMEIISYVISGQLQHQDSIGNGRTIQPGEFQYLSAGTGVRHSEFNPSATEPVHFLQIWITPREKQTEPRYQERSLNDQSSHESMTLVASPDGREDSIAIHQDLDLRHVHLSPSESIQGAGFGKRHWIHLISGELFLESETLSPGDGAAIFDDLREISALKEAEFLLFSFP